MFLVFFKTQGEEDVDQDPYKDGRGEDPKMTTTPPSSSFAVAVMMTDDYGEWEEWGGVNAKEEAEK